jgi:hypothetical protein
MIHKSDLSSWSCRAHRECIRLSDRWWKSCNHRRPESCLRKFVPPMVSWDNRHEPRREGSPWVPTITSWSLQREHSCTGFVQSSLTVRVFESINISVSWDFSYLWCLILWNDGINIVHLLDLRCVNKQTISFTGERVLQETFHRASCKLASSTSQAYVS